MEKRAVNLEPYENEFTVQEEEAESDLEDDSKQTYNINEFKNKRMKKIRRRRRGMD